MPRESAGIWSVRGTEEQASPQVHLSALIECWRDARVLRVARANAPERATKPTCTPNEEVAIGGHIECSPYGQIRDTLRSLPGDASVCGPVKLPAATRGCCTPRLVLEPVSRAVCLIDRKPLLVAAGGATLRRETRPRLSAIGRAPHIVAKGFEKTEIEEPSCFIRVGYRVAAEHVVFQNARERPVNAAIGCITPAALPEVGCVAVKLPPTDGYFVAVGRVDRNRRLVRGVAYNVVPLRIDVHLIADEYAVGGDHSRRALQPVRARRGRRHVVFF